LPGRVSVPDTSASIHAAPPVLLWKRVLDILCILLTLPITLPLMALVGIWIKLVSRGPAIFRQERIGRNGRRFTLYKFRSMHAEADTRRHTSHFAHLVSSNSPMVKLDLLDDSRLIPAGCLLRAAALDELPQLFNVLRGEMSLVGPRPCLPEEYRFFSPAQRVRFEALPGMTGIWQVMGKEACTFTEMNEMDARYVRQCAPLLDLSIMLRTPLAVLRQMSLACQRRHAALWKASFAGRGEKHIPGYHTQKLG
jgi:lipopolysaccharide/colanic/teichoic acid biosynthesis glycosyltransferase